MVAKVKNAIGTLVVAVVVLALFSFFPWEGIVGNGRDRGDRVVDFSVAFVPSPRSVDQSVRVKIVIGTKSTDTPVQSSPAHYTQMVKRGTAVSVSATQVSPGTLSCAIRIDGELQPGAAQDVSQDLRPVKCVAMVS